MACKAWVHGTYKDGEIQDNPRKSAAKLKVWVPAPFLVRKNKKTASFFP